MNDWSLTKCLSCSLAKWVSGKGCYLQELTNHGSLQPEQTLLTVSFDDCCCPVNFKVAVETDDQNPRILWQASRPLKILSSPISGNVCCSWPWNQSVPHPNWASGEVQFPRTVPRGHIYLSITRIKISQLLQSTQLMKSCVIWPSWIIPMI